MGKAMWYNKKGSPNSIPVTSVASGNGKGQPYILLCSQVVLWVLLEEEGLCK